MTDRPPPVPVSPEAVRRQLAHARTTVGAVHAGLVLTHGGTPYVAAVTNPLVGQVFAVQFSTGSGPAVDAFTGGQPVVVSDAFVDFRWPHWSERVTALGLRAVLHLPLHAGDRVQGVLSFFRTTPGFDSDDRATAAEVAASPTWLS